MSVLFIQLISLVGCSDPKPSPIEKIETPDTFQDQVFVIPISNEQDGWHDMAYLASIPASHKMTDGHPSVLAIDSTVELSSAIEDILYRLQPDSVLLLNADLTIPHTNNQIDLTAEDGTDYSYQLATTYWQQSDFAVLCSAADYSAAIIASSLASLIEAPLIYTDSLSNEDLIEIVEQLSIQRLLHVSIEAESTTNFPEEETLASVDDVLSWLGENNHNLNYLAVTNPNDRTLGRSQKASLFAPVYASLRGGLSIPISLPMPTVVIPDGAAHPAVDALKGIYSVMGYHPEYLAIVGAHDALPQTRKPSIFDNPIEEHPVSDLPYGEIDDDPFLDIAIGRIVGQGVNEQSSLATRTVQYDRLKDGQWENRFVESGLWGFDELRSLMLNVGYEAPEHLSQSEINDRESLEVTAVLHKDHSYCQVLGNAFDIETSTRLAPSIVLSRGCSVGGIDLLPATSRSIVDHMLGTGAVAFIGASRNSIAHNTVIEVSL